MPTRMNSRMLAALLTLTFSAGLAIAGPEMPEIRRIGVGDSREALNRMELKAFPSAVWANLANVTGGSIGADAIKDKPVLILTWSSWIPASQQALTRVAAAAEKYAEKGLVTVVVHGEQRYDAAEKLIAEKGYKNLIQAKDTGGKFRAGLRSGGDPGVYIIDRAGQLRFASIDPASIDAALAKVTAETAEAAAARPGELAEIERKARDEAGKTRGVGEKVEAGESKKYLKVDFPIPSSDEYDKALWPPKNDPDKGGYSLFANNVQGEKVPFDLKTVTWLSDKPDLRGKVVIFSFWVTDSRLTGRSNPLLNDLAQTFRDDLAVIAVSGYNGDLRPDVVRFLREHPSDQTQVFDGDDKIRKNMNITAFPNTFVVGTDGIVRWQGDPRDSRFRKYVEQIIANDPGARNRRAAEAKARADLGLDKKEDKKK